MFHFSFMANWNWRITRRTSWTKSRPSTAWMPPPLLHNPIRPEETIPAIKQSPLNLARQEEKTHLDARNKKTEMFHKCPAASLIKELQQFSWVENCRHSVLHWGQVSNLKFPYLLTWEQSISVLLPFFEKVQCFCLSFTCNENNPPPTPSRVIESHQQIKVLTFPAAQVTTSLFLFLFLLWTQLLPIKHDLPPQCCAPFLAVHISLSFFI